MARPNSVWWWDAHKRWAFSVGKKRHRAPATIGPDDRKAAEQWYRETMALLYPDRPITRKLPKGGRVRCEFRLKASTVRRLRRLSRLRRKATGKPISPACVIDGLVEDANKATGEAKESEKNPDGVSHTLDT